MSGIISGNEKNAFTCMATAIFGDEYMRKLYETKQNNHVNCTTFSILIAQCNLNLSTCITTSCDVWILNIKLHVPTPCTAHNHTSFKFLCYLP